jgi:hypothetical protein
MEPPRDMGAFVRVVERRSFSTGARELGLTHQPCPNSSRGSRTGSVLGCFTGRPDVFR